jgi:succinate dehydrogenase/fumarate reductase flavoprotein subunit
MFQCDSSWRQGLKRAHLNFGKEESESMKREESAVSRRNFLKTAAVGAGATALTGFGSRKLNATQLSEVRKWDYRAEIVILGIGGAGLTAAIMARDLGADVLLLEKADEAHAGGNTRVCGQGWWCPTNLDDMLIYHKALNGGYPVPEDMIKTFHQYMVKTNDWVASLGYKISLRPTKGEFSEFPGAPSTIVSAPAEGSGFQRTWKMLMENALKRKVRIMYETPGLSLIQDTKSREIRGVVAERDGKKIYVMAKKAVVLCTGGFENNQDMIRDYLQMPCGYPMGSPYNTGDGIRMAQAVGADLWHMDNQAGSGLGFRAPEYGWSFGGLGLRGNGVIRVAKDATRFIDETIAAKHGKILYHGIYVHYPTPLPVHSIFDETGIRGGPLYSTRSFMGWNSMIAKYEWSADNSVEIAKGWIVKADTIRELASKIGKDADRLEKTVATWNQSCAAGNDLEFGRSAKQMAPIQNPPFYAMELTPSFFNTQGGPRRDKNAQILDTDRKPIPRLYSAGEMGSIYSYHYQGGGNMAECLAFGRIAAERATSEKPWS